MKDQFVTYEIAKRLKELWFDEPCILVYHTKTERLHRISDVRAFILFPETKNSECGLVAIAAPLWQQAIDWLRKERGLFIEIDQAYMERNEAPNILGYAYSIHDVKDICLTLWHSRDYRHSYEETRQSAIEKALTLLK